MGGHSPAILADRPEVGPCLCVFEVEHRVPPYFGAGARLWDEGFTFLRNPLKPYISGS